MAPFQRTNATCHADGGAAMERVTSGPAPSALHRAGPPDEGPPRRSLAEARQGAKQQGPRVKQQPQVKQPGERKGQQKLGDNNVNNRGVKTGGTMEPTRMNNVKSLGGLKTRGTIEPSLNGRASL